MTSTNEPFKELGVKDWLTKQLISLGITCPTPIQQGCIPVILKGQDCIGAAKTGSGKTFAFALPILQDLSNDPYGIFALVLTPTHELAYQIADQFTILGKPMNLKVCIVTGGSDQVAESQALANRPHIVVAMPGRLADHINGCNTFSLKRIKYLVMDEADRLFGESFEEDLESVFNTLPMKRQTLLFSATLTEDVLDAKLLTLNKDNLCIWKESDPQLTVSTLDQRYVVCPAYARDVYLVETLRTYRADHSEGNVIIFVDTKKDCQLLSMTLNAVGIENVCLHGHMKQRERTAALSTFRSQLTSVLLATNVAARGLDIPTVHLVINHKLPFEAAEYIHRVGRTARAGRSGLAITLITTYDILRLGEIEDKINTKLSEYKIIDDEAVKIFKEVSVTKREQEMKLDTEDYDQRSINYRRKRWILQGLDPDYMQKAFEKIRHKKVKVAKKARLERIKKYREESGYGANNEEQPVHDKTPKDQTEQEIDSTIKKELRTINKKLIKKDDRFKGIIGKVTKISKKTRNLEDKDTKVKSKVKTKHRSKDT